MLEINQQVLVKDKPESVRVLYDRHAGMLLGYIIGVVKDHKLAEEYLVQLFTDLSLHFDEINWDGTNSWCQLQRFAKHKLAGFNNATGECEPLPALGIEKRGSNNEYLKQLTEEQKLVFCDVYYHGKTTAEIAAVLNKKEDLIRKTLKEAFAIIRKGG